MTGRIGLMGTPAEHWYYAGRDHMFFAVEADIHHGELTALALPARTARAARTAHRQPRTRRPTPRPVDDLTSWVGRMKWLPQNEVAQHKAH